VSVRETTPQGGLGRTGPQITRQRSREDGTFEDPRIGKDLSGPGEVRITKNLDEKDRRANIRPAERAKYECDEVPHCRSSLALHLVTGRCTYGRRWSQRD
jgi:hypothetical protein